MTKLDSQPVPSAPQPAKSHWCSSQLVVIYLPLSFRQICGQRQADAVGSRAACRRSGVLQQRFAMLRLTLAVGLLAHTTDFTSAASAGAAFTITAAARARAAAARGALRGAACKGERRRLSGGPTGLGVLGALPRQDRRVLDAIRVLSTAWGRRPPEDRGQPPEPHGCRASPATSNVNPQPPPGPREARSVS